jgi:hypothetical protein
MSAHRILGLEKVTRVLILVLTLSGSVLIFTVTGSGSGVVTVFDLSVSVTSGIASVMTLEARSMEIVV